MSYGNSKRRERTKNKWGGGAFHALPWRFARSYVMRNLGPYACKLLFDLLAQCSGFNNGDLCITWSVQKGRGWRSRTTLQKAKQRLLDFDDIDECNGRHDAKPTNAPPNTWLKHEPVRPLGELQAELAAKQQQKALRAA